VLLGDLGASAPQRWVVLDVVTHRGPPHEVHRLISSTAAQDGRAVTVVVPQDPGQAGVDQARGYQRELAGFDVRTRRPTGDKVTRARPWSAQVGARNVALVRAPWCPAFIAEHHAFPDGPHDDQVDAAADAFAVLVGGAGAGDGGIFAAVGASKPRTIFDLHPDDEDT
jgi:predicted phage terminase large subunit-like protein